MRRSAGPGIGRCRDPIPQRRSRSQSGCPCPCRRRHPGGRPRARGGRSVRPRARRRTAARRRIRRRRCGRACRRAASRVCAIRVKCWRQASPAAWPWVSLMVLKPSRSITSSENGSPLRSERAHSSDSRCNRWRRLATPVRSSSSARSATSLRKPVHRHQQEAEIERHRQEQQPQHHDGMALTAGQRREIAAEQIADRAGHKDRDDGDDDDAGQPCAGTDAAFLRRQQEAQRQQQGNGLSERVADHAQLHVVEDDHEEHDAADAQGRRSRP